MWAEINFLWNHALRNLSRLNEGVDLIIEWCRIDREYMQNLKFWSWLRSAVYMYTYENLCKIWYSCPVVKMTSLRETTSKLTYQTNNMLLCI